jgi:hypothetical protein
MSVSTVAEFSLPARHVTKHRPLPGVNPSRHFPDLIWVNCRIRFGELSSFPQLRNSGKTGGGRDGGRNLLQKYNQLPPDFPYIVLCGCVGTSHHKISIRRRSSTVGSRFSGRCRPPTSGVQGAATTHPLHLQLDWILRRRPRRLGLGFGRLGAHPRRRNPHG